MHRYAITFADGVTIYHDGETAEAAKAIAVSEMLDFADATNAPDAHRMTTVVSVELIGPAPMKQPAAQGEHQEHWPREVTKHERRVLCHQAKPELPPEGEPLP